MTFYQEHYLGKSFPRNIIVFNCFDTTACWALGLWGLQDNKAHENIEIRREAEIIEESIRKNIERDRKNTDNVNVYNATETEIIEVAMRQVIAKAGKKDMINEETIR